MRLLPLLTIVAALLLGVACGEAEAPTETQGPLDSVEATPAPTLTSKLPATSTPVTATSMPAGAEPSFAGLPADTPAHSPMPPMPSPVIIPLTEDEVQIISLGERLVVEGVEITLPPDAVLDGPQLNRGIPNQQVADMIARIAAERANQPTVAGETAPVYALESPDTPIYLVIRDGEAAMVSGSTGEFQVGEGHQETFQFLIDQLGADKMRLIFSEVYEMRWGPWRDNPPLENTTPRRPPTLAPEAPLPPMPDFTPSVTPPPDPPPSPKTHNGGGR